MAGEAGVTFINLNTGALAGEFLGDQETLMKIAFDLVSNMVRTRNVVVYCQILVKLV